MNAKETWAIVDKKGKIIETFRTKQAARTMKPKIRENLFYEELDIIKINNSQDLNILAI